MSPGHAARVAAVALAGAVLGSFASIACGGPAPPLATQVRATDVARPPVHTSAALPAALPLARIAILGASVSAGFAGTAFRDAFAAAAPHSVVIGAASTSLFRDPVGDTHRQVEIALAAHPTTVVALDLLFWDAYGAADAGWRARATAAALRELDRLVAAGVWVLVGDVPLITTASELLLPRDQLPSSDALAAVNAQLASWAGRRPHVIVVPLAAWSAPLRAGGEIALPTGERVPASSLMAFDGLHVNSLGDWYLLDRLDHLIETALPGTPHDALVFARPAP